VKALRRAGNRELGDDRILGSGEFVKQVLKEAEGNVKYQLPVKQQDRKIDEFITQLCQNEKVSIKELKSGSRRKEVSAVRSKICIELVKNYGGSLAEVARRVGVSITAIAKIMKRATINRFTWATTYYRINTPRSGSASLVSSLVDL
jgi:putative transposase